MGDDGLRYSKTFSLRGAVSLLAFAILAGCAAGPKAPISLPDETKARLGRVGVVSAQFLPRIDLQTPAEGGLAGAGRRAARWAGKAAGAVVSSTPGGCVGGYGCAGVAIVWLTLLVGGTVGGAVAGAISGAADFLPPHVVQAAEATLTQSLAELKLQEHVREHVVQVARSKSLPVLVLADAGPLSPDEQATYGAAAQHDIDSILELSVFTIGLAGAWDANPPLALTLAGRARLVRVWDGTEIHVTPMTYRSGVRTFTEWAANDAQAFRDELDRALQYLAESVVGQTLLTTPELPAPADLKLPWAVVVDAHGSLFIADTGNHRIRKLEGATGVLTTVAGTGTPGFAGDGDVATGAQLHDPQNTAVDPDGDLLIVDKSNHCIRKIELDTGVIATVAGTGQSGFAGDGDVATRAQLASPVGVAVDTNGDLFIADTWNHRIRKVSLRTGTITTVVGGAAPPGATGGDPTPAATPTGRASEGNPLESD